MGSGKLICMILLGILSSLVCSKFAEKFMFYCSLICTNNKNGATQERLLTVVPHDYDVLGCL